MRTKLLIVIGVLVVIGAIYAVWDYNKLTAEGKEIDARWPVSAELYKARLVTVDKFKEEVKGGMAQEQKTLADLEKNEVDLKDGKTASDQIKAINGIEKDVAKLAVALENYPDLKNSPEVQADAAKLVGEGTSVWMNHYNDEAAKYNNTIKRIRNRFVSSIFGIKDKDTIWPAEKTFQAEVEKAAKKNKKSKDKASDTQAGE